MATNDIFNLNNLLKPQISNENNLNNIFDQTFSYKKDNYTTKINSDFSNVFENAKKSDLLSEKRKPYNVTNISDSEEKNFEKKSLNKTKNKNVDFNYDNNEGKRKENEIKKENSNIVNCSEVLNKNIEKCENIQENNNVEETLLKDATNIYETCKANKDNVNNDIGISEKTTVKEEILASNLVFSTQKANETDNLATFSNNETKDIKDNNNNNNIALNFDKNIAKEVQNSLKQDLEFNDEVNNTYKNNEEQSFYNDLTVKADIKLDDTKEISGLNYKLKENFDVFNLNEEQLNGNQVKIKDTQVNEVDIQNLDEEIINNNFVDLDEVNINKNQILNFEDEKMSDILSQNDMDLNELNIKVLKIKTDLNSSNNNNNELNQNNQNYSQLFGGTSAKYNFESTNNISFNHNIKIDNISQINVSSKFSQNVNTEMMNKENILNQISNKLENLTDSQSRVNIVLRPENLGRLQLEIVSDKNGAISANLTATNENVKQLLEKNINELKNTLNSQGVNVSNINIKIENTNQASNNGLNYQNQNNDSLNNYFSFNDGARNNFNGNNENQNLNEKNKTNSLKELNQKLNENSINDTQKSSDRLVDLKV